MDRDMLKVARSALRAETTAGVKALDEHNMREATRRLAMGAYYLGHLHQLDKAIYEQPLSEKDAHTDADDAQFHAFMMRMININPSR